MPINVSWPFIWWCRLQKHNFHIETIKNDLKLNKLPSRTMSISKCETRQRFFKRVLNTYQQQSIYDCKLFSVGWLPLTETYSFNNEMGLWKHTLLFSFYSMTKTNYAAKIPLRVQLLKGKKTVTQLIDISLPLNSSISSKHVFIAVSDFGEKKNHLKPYTSVQFSPPRQDKDRILHSPGTESSQMPEVCPVGGEGGVEVSIWLARKSSYHHLLRPTEEREPNPQKHCLKDKLFSKKTYHHDGYFFMTRPKESNLKAA